MSCHHVLGLGKQNVWLMYKILFSIYIFLALSEYDNPSLCVCERKLAGTIKLFFVSSHYKQSGGPAELVNHSAHRSLSHSHLSVNPGKNAARRTKKKSVACVTNITMKGGAACDEAQSA